MANHSWNFNSRFIGEGEKLSLDLFVNLANYPHLFFFLKKKHDSAELLV